MSEKKTTSVRMTDSTIKKADEIKEKSDYGNRSDVIVNLIEDEYNRMGLDDDDYHPFGDYQLTWDKALEIAEERKAINPHHVEMEHYHAVRERALVLTAIKNYFHQKVLSQMDFTDDPKSNKDISKFYGYKESIDECAEFMEFYSRSEWQNPVEIDEEKARELADDQNQELWVDEYDDGDENDE